MDADRYAVALRPIATPLPLTFAGLLMASVVVSGYELGWIPKTQQHAAGWVLLALPIPLQLLAAWWGFAARSAAGATGSAVLAAVWIAFALDLLTQPPGPPGPTNPVGLLMFASAAALTVPVVSEALAGSLLPAYVLTTTIVRFALTGVSGVTHSDAWVDASGWAGIVVAASALYGALALELEGTVQQAVLPTFRRRAARAAVEASLEDQLRDVEHEAGVRRVL